VATFYVARSEIITPLPWLTFALPFSDLIEAQTQIISSTFNLTSKKVIYD
jgi:hypothetical protein